MGIGYVFYTLARLAAHHSQLQQAHNLNQLAMAMVWDVSRTHLDCLERERLFGVSWLNDFMNDYLSLAAALKRHMDTGLPPPSTLVEPVPLNPQRIAIATVCDYRDPNHVLYGIDAVSQRNRIQYSEKHGYISIFKTINDDAPGRHPVWTAIALPLRLLRSDNFDYVMWMDCDAMFIDQSVTIESLIARYPGNDLYISEDGRGLSGGNWIVRNSQWSIDMLDSILNNPAFDKFDLKDQFGLLWSLIRGSLTDPTAQPNGYPPNVALLPQRLINAYPWSLCRPSHHCFEDGVDFIVSFITLSSLSREMAWNLLYQFSNRN